MSESSVAVGTRAGEGSLSRLWAMPLCEPAVEALAIVLLTPMFLSVAIWNGFPLTFYDTGAYLFEGLSGIFVVERSPVYSLLLRFGGGEFSLWWIAIFQAAMTAFVLVETARAIRPAILLPRVLGIAAFLTIATGLPWYAGQIEPDCMTAIIVLAIYVLAFHSATLGRIRIGLLIAMAALATASHPSHLGLNAGLSFCVGIYWLLARRWTAWPRANPLYPVASFALAIALVFSANAYFTKEVFISRAGPVFLFARLVQDGIAKRELDAVCPQAALKLCPYRDHLPKTADGWLWSSKAFVKLKRFEGTLNDSQFVVTDSLKRFPLLHLETALRDAAIQFVTFKTGDQIEPQEWILYPDLDRLIPRQVRDYMSARQQRGEIDFAAINYIHLPMAWIGLISLLAGLGAAIRLRLKKPALFLSFILVALIGNALICGVFSNPHSRYQSRLIWLPVFALCLFATEPSTLRGIRESGT